jgi:hypothetical protein
MAVGSAEIQESLQERGFCCLIPVDAKALESNALVENSSDREILSR